MDIIIESVKADDREELTELTKRSKNYWNYGTEQIEKWRDELTLAEEYIISNHVYKAQTKKGIFGFCAYYMEDIITIKLHYLFIHPRYIGKGFGKFLITDFLNRMTNSRYKRLVLDADPHAEKFYEQFGYKVLRKLESSITDRYLPIMELKI